MDILSLLTENKWKKSVKKLGYMDFFSYIYIVNEFVDWESTLNNSMFVERIWNSTSEGCQALYACDYWKKHGGKAIVGSNFPIRDNGSLTNTLLWGYQEVRNSMVYRSWFNSNLFQPYIAEEGLRETR